MLKGRLSAFLAMTLAIVVVPLGLDASDSQPVSRIAFGSCLNQDLPAPVWNSVLAAEPDVWIWLGDNVYADSDDPEVFEAAYGKVRSHPVYAKLRESTRILGTWDDHDFGKNNGGREWQGRAVAQNALLDFLDEPTDSPRREQEGIYASYLLGTGENRVKVLLLDVRTFRGDPNVPGSDIFGEQQRAWIVRELANNDAALTLVASGTQAIPEDHRYEKWAQFPEARRWFFEQLVKHETKAVLFLSGDRHIAELSQLRLEGRENPVYELTASSMTHAWRDFPGEPNQHRVGEVFHQNNFGFLEIDWENGFVRATVRDESGEEQRELFFPL